MERGKENYDPALRGRAINMFFLRIIVAGYLIYLGGSLLYGFLTGSSGLSPFLVWPAGLLFILGGLAFAVYVWRRFRKDLADARLPEE